MPGIILNGIKYIRLCNDNDLKKYLYIIIYILH